MKSKKTLNQTPDPLITTSFDMLYWKLVAIDQELEQVQAEKERITLAICDSPLGVASPDEYEALDSLSRRETTLLQAKDDIYISAQTFNNLKDLRNDQGLAYGPEFA